MALFANALLGAPFVKLFAAWILIVVAINVRAGKNDEAFGLAGFAGSDLASAAMMIAILDATMSLDNVVALASIANGAPWALIIGVLLSIPIVIYGSLFLTEAMRDAPDLLALGAAFLGWVAGGMAVSDPFLAGWAAAYAPALAIVAPPLVVGFVLIAGADTKSKELLAAGPGGRLPRPAEASERKTAASRPRAPSLPPTAPDEPPPPFPDLLKAFPLPHAYRPAANSETNVASGTEAASMQPSEWGRNAGFAPPTNPTKTALFGLSEEQLLVVELILLTCFAGLLLVIATYFDNFT